jgi:formate hydrogenlyase subunit 3/multisubunit Na+/H+ antiporter MnhD subunit
MKMYHQLRKANHAVHFFSFAWLHFSMLIVCMVQHAVAFMVAWEIMSVASFLLVIFEGGKPGVLKAGIDYLVQMHIGALLLIVGFLIIYNETGSMNWESLTTFFSTRNNIPMFLLFFVGFGIKAGFVPLHTWLPHAHPAAPTHVSGIMSGVMIKMGIYGILRVLLHVQNDLLTIGIIILAVSAITGIVGIGTAIIQHDMKKLLAYSSIENIGIIGMGIGTGMIGVATGNYKLAVLGFGGGLLHVLNHSLFKSLLFYTTGSIYKETHTREIDKLGGLIKKMPYTALLYLFAAIAICGLPPFNGFVSEFFLYNGFAESMMTSGIGLNLLMMFAMLFLVVIGGLAIFCFTRAFGTAFLGNPRSVHLRDVRETDWFSLMPQYLILLGIIAIGVYPGLVSNTIFGLAQLYTPALETLPQYAVMNTSYISWFTLSFIGIVGLLYGIRYFFNRKKAIEHKPTWGCAYSGDASKMQYTASSYAENYYHDMDNLLNRKTDYTPIADDELFPAQRSFGTHSESLSEEKMLKGISGFFKKILTRLAIVQTGQTQHYIIYMLVLLIILVLLTIFNLI